MSANNNHFYFDYKDGKYGYNTNPNRGADTFVPFKSGTGIYYMINGSNSTSSTSVIMLKKEDIENYSTVKATVISGTASIMMLQYNNEEVGFGGNLDSLSNGVAVNISNYVKNYNYLRVYANIGNGGIVKVEFS